MVTIRYSEGKGWHDARVEPRAPIMMDPASRRAALRAGDLRGDEGLPRPTAASPCSGRGQRRRFSIRPSGWRCRSARGRLPRLAATSWSSIDRDWIPRARTAASTCARSCSPPRRSSACKPASRIPVPRDRLAGRRLLQGRRPAVTVWVSHDYTRAAPGRHRRRQVRRQLRRQPGRPGRGHRARAATRCVFLDAVERRWIEELGGMNIFFVFDDGRLVTPPLPARSCPASPAIRS